MSGEEDRHREPQQDPQDFALGARLRPELPATKGGAHPLGFGLRYLAQVIMVFFRIRSSR